MKIVRFADDFVILCKSKKKAEKVLDHVIEVLAQHGLKLHEDGTRIVSFDDGFDFIGYLPFILGTAVGRLQPLLGLQNQRKNCRNVVIPAGEKWSN